MNSYKVACKFGRGGRRNRKERRRLARLGRLNVTPVHCGTETLVAEKVINVVPKALDLTGVWDESKAREALSVFNKSGLSQRAFATKHGFAESGYFIWDIIWKKLT